MEIGSRGEGSRLQLRQRKSLARDHIRRFPIPDGGDGGTIDDGGIPISVGAVALRSTRVLTRSLRAPLGNSAAVAYGGGWRKNALPLGRTWPRPFPAAAGPAVNLSPNPIRITEPFRLRARSAPKPAVAVDLDTSRSECRAKPVPGMPMMVLPATVQGSDAPRSLIEALRRAALTGCDLVLLCRGGGAAGDLAAFDDEGLARAIAECPDPVVTGIGHEIDITLADRVADLRAATPTAAATAVIPMRKHLEEELDRLRQQLSTAVTQRLEREHAQLRHVRVSMGQHVTLRVEQSRRSLDRHERELLAAPARQVAGARLMLEQAESAIRTHLQRALQGGRATRDLPARQLVALGPSAILDRGYAVALDDEGRVMARKADFPQQREFTLRLRDGAVRAQVLSAVPDAVDRG